MSPTPADPAVNVKRRGGGDGDRRRHALVVGIDRYRDPKLQLQFCAADAARLGELLASRGFHVTALHDHAGAGRKATLAAVTEALRAIMRAADADDLVLVFFSCHGRLVGGRPHLMMADTPADDAGLASHGLPLATLLATLRGAPRWVSIFLDVCHMGLGLDPSTSDSADHGAEQGGGFALLAGSTSTQITQDTSNGGVFGKAVIGGLAGAAADPDGSVHFSALARHVQAEVARWRKGEEGQKKLSTQTPVLRLEIADLEILPRQGFIELSPPLAAKITCAAFTPDGRRLVTGAEDGSVRLWDPLTGRQVHATMHHGGEVWGVACSPDGDQIVSGARDGTLRFWTTTNARPLADQTRRVRGHINALAWSGDGTCVAIASSVGVHALTLAEAFDTPGLRRLNRKPVAMWAVVFDESELQEVITGDADGLVRSWSTMGGAPSDEGRHEGAVWAVAATRDGLYLAAGGADIIPGVSKPNLPRLYDREGETSVVLAGHRAAVTGVAFTRDGSTVATSCHDGVVRLYAVPGGELVRELVLSNDGRAEHPEAYAVTFSPDGRRLFAGYSDGRGRIFDVSPDAPAARQR